MHTAPNTRPSCVLWWCLPLHSKWLRPPNVLLHHIDMFTKAKQKHKERQIMIMIMYPFMCYFLQIGTTSLLQSTEPKHSKNTPKNTRGKQCHGDISIIFSRAEFVLHGILLWEETETDRQADQHNKQAGSQTHTFYSEKKQRQTDKQTNTTSRQTLKLTHHWAAWSHREYWCLCQQAPRSPWLARCPDWECVLTSICTQSKGKAGEHLIIWLKRTVS